METKFILPITEDETAKQFYTQASARYKINFPISELIMTANPTNKPQLLDKLIISVKYDLTFPIISSQQLTNTVKTLQKHYYFTKLPDHWISITTNKKGKNILTEPDHIPLPLIPNILDEL